MLCFRSLAFLAGAQEGYGLPVKSLVGVSLAIQCHVNCIQKLRDFLVTEVPCEGFHPPRQVHHPLRLPASCPIRWRCHCFNLKFQPIGTAAKV